MDVTEQKKILRLEMRKRVLAISGEFSAAASRKIVEKIVSSLAWQNARTVGLFSPLASEPDISDLLNMALTAGKTLCLPRVAGNDLLMCRVASLADLALGAFGILEPQPEKCPGVAADELDLIVVPGLAFDANGHRLGRGKGYYDRFLANNKALTVGAFFACQQADKIPAAEHDVRLNLVVTEN